MLGPSHGAGCRHAVDHPQIQSSDRVSADGAGGSGRDSRKSGTAHDRRVAKIYATKFIVTIDPDDARDFDDAINVEEMRDGQLAPRRSHRRRLRLRHAGKRARSRSVQRGNSVYLPDRVIPMLPERLSNGVCSLNPNVDRLTHSVFIQFDKCTVASKSARFAKTVIRSAQTTDLPRSLRDHAVTT